MIILTTSGYGTSKINYKFFSLIMFRPLNHSISNSHWLRHHSNLILVFSCKYFKSNSVLPQRVSPQRLNSTYVGLGHRDSGHSTFTSGFDLIELSQTPHKTIFRHQKCHNYNVALDQNTNVPSFFVVLVQADEDFYRWCFPAWNIYIYPLSYLRRLAG